MGGRRQGTKGFGISGQGLVWLDVVPKGQVTCEGVVVAAIVVTGATEDGATDTTIAGNGEMGTLVQPARSQPTYRL